MGRTKVFVGNLSFKTIDRDLAKEFEAAGKVASATIITRGSRSLGYGFVEMESEEDANKSIELLNKKLIDGREINVEIARPRDDKPLDPNAPRSGPPFSEGGYRGRGRGGRSFRGRRPYNRRGGYNNRGGGVPNGPEGGVNNGVSAAAPVVGSSSPSTAPAGGAPPSNRGPLRPRRPRLNRPPLRRVERGPRTPSADTLFVANLPFSIDDTGLSKIFEGLNIKSAHVVRKHNERSKGFGFVEFHNEDDQKKALNSVDKKNVEGRELSVKIALTELPRNGAAGAGGPAPVAAGPTTPAAAPATPPTTTAA